MWARFGRPDSLRVIEPGWWEFALPAGWGGQTWMCQELGQLFGFGQLGFGKQRRRSDGVGVIGIIYGSAHDLMSAGTFGTKAVASGLPHLVRETPCAPSHPREAVLVPQLVARESQLIRMPRLLTTSVLRCVSGAPLQCSTRFTNAHQMETFCLLRGAVVSLLPEGPMRGFCRLRNLGHRTWSAPRTRA